MISQIQGKIIQKKDNSLLIDVEGMGYEVFVPLGILKKIKNNIGPDGMIRLFTYYYHQVEPAKAIPVLIGFSNEVERDFFEALISVSGIGPRAALKAIDKPISIIAQAIDKGDLETLKSLPGIGLERAKHILAKLQGKVGKFCLIKDKKEVEKEKKIQDIKQEALQVLLHLQYKKKEATLMIENAFGENPQIADVEELLNEVYKSMKKWEETKK